MNFRDKAGGSAFPYSALSPEGPAVYKDSEGMTLREWFAGQALKGELASQEGSVDGTGYWSDNEPYVSNLAARCYRIADAMVKASGR